MRVVVVEGDGPAAKGPKDTNVPQFDDPGKPEGPYGGDDLDKKKEAEAPEVEAEQPLRTLPATTTLLPSLPSLLPIVA